ncbi:MAG TPA: glycosyltransferase family 2 protein, partial [Patescibacteria group bacterium]|nr:glycosyltransferase family 2 protein [Patescibacteria group bacterium]
GSKILRHFINRGQGAALQTGIFCALKDGADVIVTFDADGQHNPEEIDRVVEPLLLSEVDVVLGSRFLKSEIRNPKSEIPLSRIIILKLASWFTRLYTGLAVTDTHNGFRAISAKAASLIEIKQDGMAHASEIIEQIKKHNLKFKEVPVAINYTKHSLAKGQKLSNSFKIIWDLIISRIAK